MKRPSPFLFLPLGGLLKIFGFAKGQRIHRHEKISRPSIVLSNHTSFYDFVYTTAAIYPQRVTYLTADKLFYNPVNRVLLKLARAIPKSLFESDPAAIRNAFKILRQGGIVSVFPEGQISGVGKTLDIPPQIAKFVKKASVDVFVVKHRGAYFVNPPWTTKSFRGRVETDVFLLLKKAEVEAKSETEIYQAIVEALAFNSAAFAALGTHHYDMKDIANFENLIYRCPVCHKEGMIVKMKTALYCEQCHTAFEGFSQGMMNGVSFETRYREQEAAVRAEIDADPNWQLSSPVVLQGYRDNRLVDVGNGVLTINRDFYIYEGTCDGAPLTKQFSTAIIPTLPSDIGHNVQIYEAHQIYQFDFPEQRHLPTKFVHAAEYLYRLKNNH
jgi:1-acyl-sn-glycerol-3-phosphate acyltransferase